MSNYLFPVQIENGSVTLLPHVATEIPRNIKFTSSDGVPSELEPVLEKLYPNEKFENLSDMTDALRPTTGILVHELNMQPHSVIGFHKDLSEQEAHKIIQEIENRLGYELEGTDGLESLSSDEIEDYWPKTAGWNKDGDFVA